jgi:hypothetical protein
MSVRSDPAAALAFVVRGRRRRLRRPPPGRHVATPDIRMGPVVSFAHNCDRGVPPERCGERGQRVGRIAHEPVSVAVRADAERVAAASSDERDAALDAVPSRS